MDSTSDQAQRDRRAYALAREYLLSIEGVTPDMLERQLSYSLDDRPDSLSGIYRQLLGSATSPGMSPKVIGQAIGGIDNLSSLLGGFQPAAVVGKYGNDWEAVLDDIVTELKPSGQIRRSPRSLWPRFCKTIISGAEFLAQFEDASDFYDWVETFDRDDRSRPALPIFLSHEIYGVGFPVACEFIMDLGYSNYCKVDVHIKKIFSALGLCPTEDNYQVFKAMVRVAGNVGVTPYNVDQVFWLIGSGSFFRCGIEVGRHRGAFIEHAKNHMQFKD